MVEEQGVSRATFYRLRDGKQVSTEVLAKICAWPKS